MQDDNSAEWENRTTRKVAIHDNMIIITGWEVDDVEVLLTFIYSAGA